MYGEHYHHWYLIDSYQYHCEGEEQQLLQHQQTYVCSLVNAVKGVSCLTGINQLKLFEEGMSKEDL